MEKTILHGRLTNNEFGDRIFEGTTRDGREKIERFVLAEFFANSKKYIVLCDSLFPSYNDKLGAFVSTDGNKAIYLTPVTEYDDLKIAASVISTLGCNNNYKNSLPNAVEESYNSVDTNLFFIDEDTISNRIRLKNYILKTMKKHPAFTELEKELISSVMVEIISDDGIVFSELKEYWKGVYNKLQNLSDEDSLSIIDYKEERISAIADYVESNSISDRVREYVGAEVHYILTIRNSEIVKLSNAQSLFNIKRILIDLKYSAFAPSPDGNIKYKAFLKEWPPSRIASFLNGSEPTKDKNGIFGQDDACNQAASILYNHVKRISDDKLKDIEKDNFLFIGPTGSGKTGLMKRLSKLSPTPVIFIDGASLVEEGFRGLTKNDVLTSLITQYGKSRLERSILVLDEVDKLFTPSFDSTGTDIHKQIQHSFLKLLENSKVILQSKAILDTSNITIVLLGAFEGLEGLIEKRTHGKCGFLNSQEEIKKCRYEELRLGLKKYGATSEILGRISCITRMRRLSKDTLKKIAVNKTMLELEKMYATDGVMFKYDADELLNELDSINLYGGARGVKTILLPVVTRKTINVIGKNCSKTVEITGQDIHKELYDS